MLPRPCELVQPLVGLRHEELGADDDPSRHHARLGFVGRRGRVDDYRLFVRELLGAHDLNGLVDTRVEVHGAWSSHVRDLSGPHLDSQVLVGIGDKPVQEPYRCAKHPQAQRAFDNAALPAERE